MQIFSQNSLFRHFISPFFSIIISHAPLLSKPYNLQKNEDFLHFLWKIFAYVKKK